MNKQSIENNEKNLVGTRLGDYQILRRLGRGGMAEVYLAEQESLGRKVAIKVLRTDFSTNETYVRRFQFEARAVALLVHANIVQVYEVGCIDGVYFIAQEYVPGQTLKQLVSKDGPLSVSRAISILKKVAAALTCAGRENMVHRDIKPENILLSTSGEVKVADFGLARVTTNEKLDLTQDGMTMGTPLYMSPEQVEGNQLDQRSDIYSCGVMAFFMLVGHPPFEGDTPLNVAIQHVQKDPPLLSESRSDVPKQLCQIVAKMLRKRPEERFSTARDLLIELKKLSIDSASSDYETDEFLDPDETAAASLDATIQLQSVMETQTMMIQKQSKSKRLWLPILLIFGSLVGILAARANWEGPILDVEATPTKIEKKETARDQFFEAFSANKESAEAAWKAVEKHFPGNDLWVRRAKQNLADLYLSDNRPDAAFAVYSELASLEETEVEFKSIGLAGQAIVYGLTGKEKELRGKLIEVWEEKWRLEPKMREELTKFAEKYGIDKYLDPNP